MFENVPKHGCLTRLTHRFSQAVVETLIPLLISRIEKIQGTVGVQKFPTRVCGLIVHWKYCFISSFFRCFLGYYNSVSCKALVLG